MMSERDHQIIEAVGQAYRTDGKAVPSTIYPRLPETCSWSMVHLKKNVLPDLVMRGLLVKLPGRYGYKPAKYPKYCPYCGQELRAC